MNNFNVFFIIFFFVGYTYSLFLIFNINQPYCLDDIKLYNMDSKQLMYNESVKMCIFYKNSKQYVTVENSMKTYIFDKIDIQKTTIHITELYNKFIEYHNYVLIFPYLITISIFFIYYIGVKYYKFYNITKKIIVKLDNNNQKECPICLNSLCGKICITKCNHEYHYDCLDEWMNFANTCPNCRTIM